MQELVERDDYRDEGGEARRDGTQSLHEPLLFDSV